MSNLAPLPISIENGWEYGYLNTSGNVTTSGSVNNGMVSPFIEIQPEKKYNITPDYTLPSQYSGWLAYVQYNESKTRVGNRSTVSSSTSAIPTANITTRSDAKYIRVCASNLYNDENASMIVENPIYWTMDSNSNPIPIQSLSPVTDGFVKPYPASLWRIDGSNDGLPYIELMPDVVYVFPEIHLPNPPEINTGQTTVIDDASSIEYIRYQVGYTNPNLYRFRDGELPEGVKCEVSIRGTNSYRYTEIPNYEDGSTTCEIP